MFVRRSLSAILGLVLVASTARLHAESPIHPDEGVAQVLWENAKDFVGQTTYVFGKVTSVKTVGNITFINFDTQRPERFAGVIFEDNLKNFPTPPSELYKDKIVRLRGRVSLYKDKAEIAVKEPGQVEILTEMPKAFVPSHVTPRQAKPDEVVVAEYNVLNLFDDVDDPYHEDEGTPAKPRAELTALAKSIAALNADVIAMEEVESREYLKRFLDVFLPDLGYKHVVCIEGNDGRGIDVALVSRIPIGEVRTNQYEEFPGPEGTPMRFMRDVVSVTLEPAGAKPFDVWVLHLKSNVGGEETTRPIRVAEARHLRELLDKRYDGDPEARYIVTGDFNDHWGSEPLNILVGEGAGALWSAGSDFADKTAVTYNEGEFRSVIDFLLCSPAMAKHYVKGSYRNPQGSAATTGSDHNPIVAAFKFDAEPASK